MDYEERDIRTNDAWLRELIDLGSQGTPTTVIEAEGGTREVIIGFDRGRLTHALGI